MVGWIVGLVEGGRGRDSGQTYALEFENLSCVFPDGTRALENIDLHVSQGEIVALLGPSGCGKSTLLRIAAGLEENYEGSCRVDRDRIGFVFQDPTLMPWRTVSENIGLLLELRGVPATSRDETVRRVLAQVGLEGSEDRFPHQLSGGMRMRTSVGRTLAINPRVCLFDEPFAALDEINRELLNDELLSIFATESFACLFVTHSIAEAVYLSHRVVVLSARPGRKIAELNVPFTFPRTPELRYSPQFSAVTGELNNWLRKAMIGE